MKWLGALITLLFCGVVSFGVFACLGMLICWCFGIAFNIKVVFGVWLVVNLFSSYIKGD